MVSTIGRIPWRSILKIFKSSNSDPKPQNLVEAFLPAQIQNSFGFVYYSDHKKPFKTPSDADTIPRNVAEDFISAQNQSTNGIVYDKKPFKMPLVAGKKYSWCLCGRSKTQPLCDGTHKNQQLKITHKPVRFVVEETKEYWLCNCKQTSHRPFCDGTHKTKEVEDATSIIRQ